MTRSDGVMIDTKCNLDGMDAFKASLTDSDRFMETVLRACRNSIRWREVTNYIDKAHLRTRTPPRVGYDGIILDDSYSHRQLTSIVADDLFDSDVAAIALLRKIACWHLGALGNMCDAYKNYVKRRSVK